MYKVLKTRVNIDAHLTESYSIRQNNSVIDFLKRNWENKI